MLVVKYFEIYFGIDWIGVDIDEDNVVIVKEVCGWVILVDIEKFDDVSW